MFTLVIHRFQPRTGKHRNQVFELATQDEENGPPSMALSFGETDRNRTPYDLVARNHAVTRVDLDATHGELHIWTAPLKLRPYNEKVARDLGKYTPALYEPLDRKPEEPIFSDEEMEDAIMASDARPPVGGTNSGTNSALRDNLLSAGKVREARAWAYANLPGSDD